MKKVLLASLLLFAFTSIDAMAAKKNVKSANSKKAIATSSSSSKKDAKKSGKWKRDGNDSGKDEVRAGGPGKPTFTDGCLVAGDDVKGPMADAVQNADSDGDGCITEDELKSYMKEHKPSGKGGPGADGGEPPAKPDDEE